MCWVSSLLSYSLRSVLNPNITACWAPACQVVEGLSHSIHKALYKEALLLSPISQEKQIRSEELVTCSRSDSSKATAPSTQLNCLSAADSTQSRPLRSFSHSPKGTAFAACPVLSVPPMIKAQCQHPVHLLSLQDSVQGKGVIGSSDLGTGFSGVTLGIELE